MMQFCKQCYHAVTNALVALQKEIFAVAGSTITNRSNFINYQGLLFIFDGRTHSNFFFNIQRYCIVYAAYLVI